MDGNLVSIILSSSLASSVLTVVGYFFSRPKNRAEAAAKRAEGAGIDVGSQQKIIDGWEAYAAQLEARLSLSDARISAIEQRDHLLSLLVFEQTLWQQKAYLVMTTEQRQQVGPPPEIDPRFIKQPPGETRESPPASPPARLT